MDSLKNMFNAARYRSLASELTALSPVFNATTFLDHTLTDLSSRELMDRMRRTSTGVALALPLSYREQLAVLRALAPRIGHNFIGIFLSDCVAQHGLDDVPASIDALRFFTRFGSAEFAIRPFILRDQSATLAVLQTWTSSDDEHVAEWHERRRVQWDMRSEIRKAWENYVLNQLDDEQEDGVDDDDVQCS